MTVTPAKAPNPTGSDRVTKWDTMGEHEKEACTDHLIQCITASNRDAMTVPWDESEKYFPTPAYNGVDDRRDAARHCIWMGMMTAWGEEDFAREFADAHEIDEPSAPNDPAYSEASRNMDFYNNETGVAVGLRHDDDTVGIINECITRASAATKVPIGATPAPSSNTAGNDLVFFNGL